MQIDISFPQAPTESGLGYVKSWLKQVELAVHHAQKSLDEMAKMIRERDEGRELNSINAYFRGWGFESDEGTPSSGLIEGVEIRLYED